MQTEFEPARPPISHTKLVTGLQMAQEPMAQIMVHGASETDVYILHRLDRAISHLRSLRALVGYRQTLATVALRG